MPVSKEELDILRLIIAGFHDVNIHVNKTNSLFGYLKIEFSNTMQDFLYNKFFAEQVKQQMSKAKGDLASLFRVDVNPKIEIKKADQIRIANVGDVQLSGIYEFVLLEHLGKLVELDPATSTWSFHYFTLFSLEKNTVALLNHHVKALVKRVLDALEDQVDLAVVIRNAADFIERNKQLLKYDDQRLYDHQKEIFTVSKTEGPKLILYIAPTGTGKTLTPLGLSEQRDHRIIFVCAARHVGLALARAAISVGKKIAFAFGCSSAEDIRLHYFAAKDFTKDRRSGGIRKVDNTVGDRVEIMICDIRSYLPAMYYMMAFNSAENITTYWDEPTITLDYKDHELHEVIQKNWRENLIPHMVLSSATLPRPHELPETVTDFKEKFKYATVHSIVSHDCRKTIPLVNKQGFVVMPHYLSDDYAVVQQMAEHCKHNLSLLRYLDLQEVSAFIDCVERNGWIKSSARIGRNFGSLEDVNMRSIKMHYLKCLKNVVHWSEVCHHFKTQRVRRILPNDNVDAKGNKIRKVASIGPGYQSAKPAEGAPLQRLASLQPTTAATSVAAPFPDCAIYVTTKDAYTLTDGPTIFLAQDVEKIAKFCIQQANIPDLVMSDIMQKIEFNNRVNEKIVEAEQNLEDAEKARCNDDAGSNTEIAGKRNTSSKEKKLVVDGSKDKKIGQLREQVELYRSMIKNASLNDVFVPNKLAHLKKWAEDQVTRTAFTSDLDEATVVSIMMLHDVENTWKVLLLLGIGVFANHKSADYTEIMKKLADQQRLYMIIADSDYIYGTNYQFCHGYLSKDMDLTQEKIIQAMGRIGRNNIQQEYSVRFRDDEQIRTLFRTYQMWEKPEVINMNVLLNSKKVEWNGSEFVTLDAIVEVDVSVTA